LWEVEDVIMYPAMYFHFLSLFAPIPSVDKPLVVGGGWDARY